ncbi:hypothetical protein ACJMK2_033866 [Sinanodonta woodiana]|uniref:Cadherin domain-containing protein n=1 Tax=Sinanodonta woodiana TaxID=1069815 RepID=A0ABD3WPR1_SINWO
MFDPDIRSLRWSFCLLTIVILLADVRAQTPCSMAPTITVALDEGNVTANQVLSSTSPYQASLPVTGTLGGPTGITLIMTADNPLSPNPNSTFRIEDIGTGTRIRLITSVDRDGPGFTNLDDTEIISFQLKCTSNADSSTTAYAKVNVNIRDVNDNSPQFFNTPYFLSVEEFTPVGTTIYRQISAMDKDSGVAATIDYTLSAGDGSVTDGTRKFSFTSTRFPNLIISQSLDFEPMYALGQTTYVMNVMAKDLGTPTLSSVTQVNVTITDSDDMAPTFVYANCLLSGIYCVDPRYSTSVVSGQITNSLTIYPLVGFTRQTATTIRAVDRDTLRSPLTFRIAGASPVGYENYFAVAGSGPVPSGDKDVYTATLTQLRVITRNSNLTRVEVYILATQANLKYEERATVSVEIDVPNNSPPTVTTATGVSIGYIYENSRLGQNVLDRTTSSAKPLQLIVTDPDDSISGQKTTFSFSATGTGLFNVDSNGYIYLASGNLDYETTKSATINARVTETNTAERRFTDVTVTIQVLDKNDNDPVFTSTAPIHVSVPEGDYTFSSRLLAQVDATDADSGVNRILVYSIVSIEPNVTSGFFTINTNTGDVSLSGRVTYPSNYVVVVKASDSAVPPDTIRSATKNMYVNVTSTGNNAPQIPSTLYTVTISEGTMSGTSIFTVPARDPDGQVLSYSITAGNAAGKFSIDSSGQIITVGSLDREVTPTYGLTVTVRDTTTPLPLSATTTVSVILTDVNDNNPVFPSQYQFNVLENQPAGTSVGTVTATDADQPGTANSELTYRLNQANSFFAINPSTGQITTLQALDYESQSQYIFGVLAVDHASDSRTGTVSVTVFVTDVQDSVPLFTQQILTANVAEGNANAFVVVVSAVDADAVDNIQYRFLSPASATTFNINSASGQINTAIALDYETQRFYEFYVTTVDGQGSTNPSSTATVQVTVLDQNDNSPILSLPVASVQVFEDAEVNRVLVTVSATDADAANTTNSEIRFVIVSVSPSSGSSFFSIDRDNSQLVIERSLTNDPGVNQYQIIIRASDRGTPVLNSQATFTVNVIRNTAPSFNSSSVTVSINHNIPTTTTVTSIQAVDTDPGDYGRLNYLLLGDSIASRYFQLVPAANGVNINTIDLLTKDTARTYYLTISAKDNAGIVSKTATATVTVNVNRNLHDPRWLNLPVNLQTTISITENDPLGQAVLTLSAEDLDILSPDNQVEFRLTGNTQAQNYFRIDSIGYNGVISLIRSPVQDRTINQFTLTVSLTDKGVPPRSAGTATVLVNVLRNDQPPVYFNSTNYAQLREDVAISTSVVQVLAMDSDTNSNFNQITYRIIGDDTAPNFFTIVSSGSMAGWITTSGNLASDSTDTFRIRVEATDNGAFPRKATALVFVKVLRNFNSPLWPLNQLFGSVTIPENQNLDSTIFTLPSATDKESTSPNNITNYRLIGSVPSQGQNYYQVNAATGEVSIKKDLTRDPGVTPYRLTFQAYDLGTPSLTGTQTFTLTVNVYRNTPPVFNPNIYSTMVDETRNVNSNILTLSASDSDAINIPGGLFSQLTYRIASPASVLPYFSVLVENVQVVLRIVSLLTNAPRDKYLLIVQVTDDGGLSNYAEVTVDIRRNLNAPLFTQTSYVVNITEDRAVGSGIGVTVLATDSDLRSPYRDVSYFETGQPVSLPYFDVNPSSGEVTVARPLTDGTASQYIYTISARDGGNLQATNFVTVTINVFRNLNPPIIINLPDRRPVAKTTNLGIVIFTVQATDADTVVPFNTLSYSLVAGDMSAFRINGNGDISVATNLTAYGKAELQVVAQVCNGGMNRRCDSEILTVVVDSNLNEPVFVRPGVLDGFRATVTVRENIDSTYIVYDVDATDADTSSPFNDLTYTLTGLGTGLTYFGISPTDGRITIRLSLLQDTATQYNLTVIVRDGGSPPRQAAQTGTIVVNVIRNNNAPLWQNLPQTQAITQSYGINNIVYTANAIDSDQVFNVVTYSIAGVGTAPSFFTINPNTGVVTLTGDIRTVSDTTFYLLIRASDNGTPPKSTDSVLTILVQRNEFSPNFVTNSEVFSLRIPETQTIGVAITRVNATDQDSLAPYNTVKYNVIGDTLASIYFNVNSTSGEIFVKFPLQSDPANTQTYTLTIQARDGGSPSRISVNTARVTIEVYRNLNAPRFSLADYITSIPETTPVGTSIFLLAFFDSDTDAPFNTMSLTAIGDRLGSSYFNVDNTGRVTTNRNLAPESANTYQLRVRVQDGGSPPKSGTTVLTIQLQRNLLAPVFVPVLYNTTILETRDTGDIILIVTAIDADTEPPNNIVHYSISTSTSSDVGRQYFMIDEATGGISLRKSAMSDTNRATLYTFQVIATDRDELQQKTSSIPADVRITVLRNDFTPSFTNLNFETTINETQPINTVVFDLDAIDQDSSKPFGPFATLAYTIIGDDSSSLYFSIDSAGVIRLVQRVLNLATTVYKVRVRVRDGGTPPKETTTVVTVNVRRNFFSPSFLSPSYITTIQEVLPVGSFVLDVSATDADRQAPYNTVMYAFLVDDDLFDIDRNTGRITVQSSLLGQIQNSYQYQIYAYDGGKPSQKSNNIPLTINIIRNQFPPEILNLPSQVNITNSFVENDLVFTVQYRDNDTQAPFNTISTEIVGVVPTTDLFKINPVVANQASILMNRNAKTGTQANYYIWVRARDGGSPSKTNEALLKVIVTRNCQPPTFSPFYPDNNLGQR